VLLLDGVERTVVGLADRAAAARSGAGAKTTYALRFG
jgi:hypothetical protein